MTGGISHLAGFWISAAIINTSYTKQIHCTNDEWLRGKDQMLKVTIHIPNALIKIIYFLLSFIFTVWIPIVFFLNLKADNYLNINYHWYYLIIFNSILIPMKNYGKKQLEQNSGWKTFLPSKKVKNGNYVNFCEKS